MVGKREAKGSWIGWSVLRSSFVMPLGLVQKIVKSNCTRRVGKEAFSVIEEVSQEFLEVGMVVTCHIECV